MSAQSEPWVRGYGPSILVTALSSAFGVSLTSTTGVLGQVIRAADLQSETLDLILSFIAVVFIAIALYVGAVVTSNTFSTIVAGRVRAIALRRLIGSSANAERRAVALDGLVVGAIGAVSGAVLGVAVTAAITGVAMSTDLIPAVDYALLSPLMVLPIFAVVLTTVAASWAGSRRVLAITPIQALGASVETSLEQITARRSRTVTAIVLFVTGGALLVLGVVVGLVTPMGILIALTGGILSFSGVVAGAHVVMPRMLRFIGRFAGTDAAAQLARQNAVRAPERSTRATIGLVIAITLITTFAVAVESFQSIIRAADAAQPGVYEGVAPVLQITVTVFSALMSISALIAAVGMMNNLSLNVMQRTRDLGLLRALGFTGRQVRRMILVESAVLTAAAVVVGLVLGVFYGWAGAQSLLGGVSGSPGIVVPSVPLILLAVVLAVVLAGAAVLAAAASVVPVARTLRSSPVAALASE